jgi:hypothetical protein
MFRLTATVLLLATLAASVHSQSNEPLPTEQDTVVIGRIVVLASIGGEVLIEGANGVLRPAERGTTVEPGHRLLVRKGAWFSIGRTKFGPESHGDRWVKFQ